MPPVNWRIVRGSRCIMEDTNRVVTGCTIAIQANCIAVEGSPDIGLSVIAQKVQTEMA